MTQSAAKRVFANFAAMRSKPFSPSTIARYAVFAVFYALAYWFLDWVSFVYTFNKLDITPWNPPVAASVILLFVCGLSWSPLLFLAAFSFQVFFEHPDAPLAVIGATSLSEAVIYTAAAWLVKNHFRIDTRLRSLHDVIVFSSVFTGAAACMGTAYVVAYYFAGQISAAELFPLGLEYAVGDAVGILILAPLFLINWPVMKTRTWVKPYFSAEALRQYFFAAATVLFVFFMDKQDIHVFYLFFIPVLWVAVRNGLSRVSPVLFVMQASIIFCSWELRIAPHVTIQFLPFIMLTLTWTGLLLGALTNEKEGAKLANTKNEARLKALLEMAPDSMIIVDMQGFVVTANKSFMQLYGVDKLQKLIGKHIEKILPTFYPELNGEAFILLENGKDIPIEISSSKVPVGDKYSSILTVRDITDRKRAETQLRQRRAATEQASRTNLTGGLAAVLAHELNQPLSAIMSYSSACMKIIATSDRPPARVAEQLDKIGVQAQRAGDIIRRLRDFFQNSNIEITKVDVAELVNESLMLLEDEIIQNHIDVEVHVTDHIAAAIDRIQVEQVLMNLIRNSIEALKEAPKGKKRIRITGDLSMRGDIEMTVTDTGPGISPEIADQLFSPFVTTRLSGMGLGLTISRSIVEAHNGRLWAELQAASGAALHFTIPAYREE